MRTKLHLTLWLIALLLGLMGTSLHARGQTSGDIGENNSIHWEYDEATKTLAISGQGEMPDYLDYDPDKCSPWFKLRDGIENVKVEDGITSIGKYAFSELYNLESITLPESVISIRDAAFAGAKSLSHIVLPNKITIIGSGAFAGCTGLTSIIIPDEVREIGRTAFTYCTGLRSITIPAKVEKIGEGAFNNCDQILKIEIASGNKHYISINGVLFDKSKNTLIQYPIKQSATTYVIPSEVKRIGDLAFRGNKNLTSVIIPNGLKEIGYDAFCATGLTSINIPASVDNIGGFAFSECNNLFSITVDPRNKHYASEDGVFFYKSKSTLVQYPVANTRRAYTIPSSVKDIVWGAFTGSQHLTSVTIPDGVEIIGVWAFGACPKLKSIVIPESVTELGDYAFARSPSLESVTIPSKITEIGYGTFESCSSLRNVTIGARKPPVCSNTYASFDDRATLYHIALHVPPGTAKAYREATFWKEMGRIIEIGGDPNNPIILDNVISGKMGSLSWEYNRYSKTLTISGQGEMPSYFNRQTPWREGDFNQNIEKVIIQDGVTNIGCSVFLSLSSLNSIKIPSGVKKIDDLAFVFCSNLRSIIIPAEVEEIGDLCFDGCENLKDVVVAWHKPISIEHRVFEGTPLAQATLHVPAGTKAAYEKADVWKDFGTIVEDAGNPSGSQSEPQPGESEWPSNITNDDDADYYVSSIAPATFVQPVNGDTPCPNGNFTAYGRNNLVAGAVVETGGTVCIVIKPVNNTGKFTKAGTTYIKQGDVCGTPLAEATYAVGDKQVVIRLKPNFTYGSRTYVPMIKTAAGGERFYTRPITITCKAKVGYIDDPALSMHPRITTAGTSIEARGDMFSRGATVKLQFSGPTDITATDITTDATGHFAYSFTLPATAKSGYYTVTAIEPSTGRTKTSRFQVTPAEDPSTPTPTPKSALELIAPIGSQTIYSGENLDLSWKDAVNLEADRKNDGRKYKIEASIDGGSWQFITDVTDNTVYSDGETITYSEQYDPEHKSALRSALEGHALRSGRTDFTFKLKVIKDISAAVVGSAAATANTIVTELMNWKTVQKHTYNPVFLEWDRTDDPDNTPSRMGVKGVAADGVARIRMEYSKDKLDNRDKEVTSIRVTLSDDRNSTATNILGKIMVCSEEGVGTYQAAKNADGAFATIAETSIRHKDGKFRFWYVAPEDFSRGGQDDDAGKRIVYADFKVTYANGETKTVRRKIEIVRPPLMLVHGLNGDAGTWKDFALRTKKIKYKKDDRFIVATAPDMAPRSHFKLNASHLMDKSTNDKGILSVIRQMRKLGYACNQVDYVCHSMGGSILRYAEEAEDGKYFYRKDNYGKGFVHKFITLHTPHNGSSFANLLCDPTFNADFVTTAKEVVAIAGVAGSYVSVVGTIISAGAAKYIVSHIVDQFYDQDNQFYPHPAIWDLRYKDGVKFHDTPLRSHLIAGGIDCSDEKNIPSAYKSALAIMNWTTNEIKGSDEYAAFKDYFTTHGFESDFMDMSDGIVSLNSQFSAPPKKHSTQNGPINTSFFPGIMHTGILDAPVIGKDPTNTIEVGKRVNELLNAPVSSALFASIPATRLYTPIPTKKASTRRASTETKPRLRSAEPGKVKIESPGVGDTYRPGETVTVKIKVDTENLAGLFLSFQDQVVEVESPISEMEVRMQVGDEQTETQEIHATALYRTGQEMAIGSDSRTVVVKSPDNATSLEVSPRTLVMEKGTSRRPEYTALYTGSRSELGNTPDIAVTIDNPAIASYDAATNTFKGLSAGKTYAVATWRGLTRTFVVDVMEDVTPPSDPVEDPTPTPTPTPSPSPSTPATPPVASNVHPTAVTIEPSSIALSEGKTATLKAVVTPANASNRAVSWSTSDASVAMVDNLGLVTALKSGTATVTATTNDGGLKATCSVTVTNHVGNLAVPGGVSVWSSAGRLHVQSPAKETIEVFDFAGKLLLRADKAAGEAVYDLDMPAGVTIVKGSSGWTRKVKN